MYMHAKDLQQLWSRDRYARYSVINAVNPQLRRRLTETSPTISLGMAREILRDVREAVVSRDRNIIGDRGLGKWIRPWTAVPSIRNFRAPSGDFGVGIEIERGFVSREAASTIAKKVRNWHYLALDWEGGHDPIEATFAPILYSKFNSRCQPMRYTKILQENSNLLVHHPSDHSSVGIHVNVSSGDVDSFEEYSLSNRLFTLRRTLTELSREQCSRYFGRSRPYGWMYNQGRFIECKMFNSVADPAVLRRYVDIAVALVDFLSKEWEDINRHTVTIVLEQAYNKRTI